MSRVIRRWPIAASSLAAVALAACGSSGGDGASTTPRPETNAAPAGLERFAQCMRDEGVDVPDAPQDGAPQGGPPFDPSDEQVQQALEACRDALPEGGPGGGAPPTGGDAQEEPSA